MKKILVAIITIFVLVTSVGCNKQIIDITYSFNRAIISMPDGSVLEGKVQSWKDYDGDQIQVKIDGVTYLVHSSEIVLIHD